MAGKAKSCKTSDAEDRENERAKRRDVVLLKCAVISGTLILLGSVIKCASSSGGGVYIDGDVDNVGDIVGRDKYTYLDSSKEMSRNELQGAKALFEQGYSLEFDEELRKHDLSLLADHIRSIIRSAELESEKEAFDRARLHYVRAKNVAREAASILEKVKILSSSSISRDAEVLAAHYVQKHWVLRGRVKDRLGQLPSLTEAQIDDTLIKCKESLEKAITSLDQAEILANYGSISGNSLTLAVMEPDEVKSEGVVKRKRTMRNLADDSMVLACGKLSVDLNVSTSSETAKFVETINSKTGKIWIWRYTLLGGVIKSDDQSVEQSVNLLEKSD